MQPASEHELDRIFQALSDSTRRDILRHIGSGERTVSELAEPYDLTLAAVSKHLKVLEAARLIDRRKDGSFQMIKLNAEALKSASEWLTFYQQFWSSRLNELERILTRKKPGDKS
jgi:DNA-binding transcriptional ArsR family regulator